MSFDRVSARAGLVELMSSATLVALGTIPRSNSSRFGPTSTAKVVTPVRLPPGRARLATSPIWTGSIPIWKTIGMLAVAAFAASAAGAPPIVAITVTLLANQISRQGWQAIVLTLRPSIFATFRPSIVGLAQALTERA
jgi:hypothetical protein